MAPLFLSLSLLLLSLLLLSLSSANAEPSSDTIEQACKATRFPDSCTTTLTQSKSLPTNPTALDLLLAAVAASSENLKTAESNARAILAVSSGNPNRTNAANNCIEHLAHSSLRLAAAAAALPVGRRSDARAWTSAALLYQYDCFSALKYVNGTKQVGDAMTFLVFLTGVTSNSLSMIASYQRFGNDTAAWIPPQTERDGYWGDDSAAGTNGGDGGSVPADLTVNAKVCKQGDGCYRTVQAAVDAAPENGTGKFVISIEEGIYEETVRIPFEKTNVVFLGAGMGKTVITGNLNAGMVGVSTYNTATVGVNGDGFMAKGITFENTAGPDAHQAVAFRSDSDFSIMEEVEFLGHQDTLYAHSLRQFYKSCCIAGTVDFVFGNSATILENCLILVRPRQQSPEKGETNAVTAQGRTDPAQATGFVFQNCTVNGTDDYVALFRANPAKHRNYLGRPWKEYSRTVFLNCYLEALVMSEGWMPWDGDFALKTLFYGEFESTGPGANATARVAWSSQIPPEHVAVYSLNNFIQGNECFYLPTPPDHDRPHYLSLSL